MNTDKKATKILARTFFSQLRSGGYTSNQILGIATELIALVTVGLKEEAATQTTKGAAPDETRMIL